MLHKNRVKNRTHMTSFQVIIISFFCLILVGTLLLMLPISSRQRCVTSFPDAMFTAVSATCVTGLVVKDTATYWSLFGQAVILMLIQIGGMGVITIGLAIIRASGRKIGLRQRSTMQDAISAPKIGGIVRLTKFSVQGTLFIELLGMTAMLPVFFRDYGIKGIWMAAFHSVSAFCNAGFDLLGTSSQPFVSLSRYIANPLINLVIMLLIIIGGIGFLTWDDICSHKWHIRRYRVQSKVILWTSALLIIIPAVFFFVVDFTGSSTGTRLLASTFQSVTTRTAGFNTADLTAMTPTSKSVMIMLMLIGGSPGSTAGGMKTTTFAVLILNMVATFRQKEDIEIFGRRLDSHAIKNAATIVALYIIFFFIGGIAISSIEHLPLLDCLFETASAVGTVGLTLGITPTLGIPSQLILILLMFFGRVGGLTLIYAAISVKQNGVKLPLEKITVG
jgi:trk system potassium uptake protein TrkH